MIKLTPPEFSPADPEMYLQEVELWWELASNLQVGNRVLALLYSVPSDHPSGFKEYLLSQHTVAEYKGDTGKQMFIDAFNTMFAIDHRVKMVEDFKKFTTCKRRDSIPCITQLKRVGWFLRRRQRPSSYSPRQISASPK